MVSALVWKDPESFGKYVEGMRVLLHDHVVEPEIVVALVENAPTLDIVPPGNRGRN